MKNRVVSSVLFSFWLLAASVRAEIIVDHQPHPYGGLGADTSFLDPFGRPVWQLVGDNFVWSSPDQAVGIVFFGFYHEDNPPAIETIRIRIYGTRAGAGLPDDNNVISETTVQNPTRTATGRIVNTGFGPHEYRYESELSSPASLDAGSLYWLEVAQIGDITTHFRWETSVAEDDGLAFINDRFTDWQLAGNAGDAAFQLITPEPASFAMLALGVVLSARR